MNMARIKRLVKQFPNFLSGLFRKIERKVVFDSFHATQYSDNPRFISEKMHELYPDYTLVWGIQKGIEGVSFPEYVKVYTVDSWKYRQERATAAAYIRNEAMSDDLYKKPGQLFIQTWHGDRGMKRILYDAWQNGNRPSPVMDEKITDLFVIGSDYAEKRIQTAFRYHGRALKEGCPRNDCLIQPKNRALILEKLGLNEDRKILLYAPTLRRRNKMIQATVNLDETLCHFHNRGGEWVCLVRAHPKALGVSYTPGANVMDVSGYPDMADLLMVADALITDYSSSAGDFALRGKPLILAHFDLEQYEEECRSFCVDIGETGYLVARNQQELNHMIDTLSDEQFAESCGKALRYFGTRETGRSAEAVCHVIDEHYRGIQ